MDKSVYYTPSSQSVKRSSLDLPISKYSPTKNSVSYPYGAIKEESTVDEVNKEHNLTFLPYNGELCRSLNHTRKCVQLSYSCSEINYTVKIPLKSTHHLNKECSSSKSSICVQDTSPLDKLEVVEITDTDPATQKSVSNLVERNSPVKNNSDSVFQISDPSEMLEYTNPNSDCITSTTEDDTFYSPLEELSVSTLSLSIDLPTESYSNFETNQSYSLSCDVFTAGQIEETNSVLGEDLDVDKTENDRPSTEDQKSNENLSAAEPAVSCSSFNKPNITGCFPI